MKFKVFGIILISFILVMPVNGALSAFGESLKTLAAKSIFSKVTGSQVIIEKSLEDINSLPLSSDYIEKYKEAAKNVTPRYYWYFVIIYVFQAILIIGIAMAASFLTINTVKRGLKL